MDYNDYLKSDHWKHLKIAKNKKPRRCSICGTFNNLHTHHLNYRNLFDVELSDLRILCKTCHFTAHDLIKNGKIVFKSKNHHSRFTILKTAVKKELGLTGKNMFLQHSMT